MNRRLLAFPMTIALAAAVAVAGRVLGLTAVARYALDAGVLAVGRPLVVLWSEPALMPSRALSRSDDSRSGWLVSFDSYWGPVVVVAIGVCATIGIILAP